MSYEREMVLDAETPPELDEREQEERNEWAADLAYERLRDRQDEQASALVIAVNEYQWARDSAFEADRHLALCNRKLMAEMQRAGRKSHKSPEHHITVTVATRRTPKVVDERELAYALNEIGEVVPRKESIDTARLMKLIDGMGHDLPGVEVSETEYLTVTAQKS
ncbi:MAG: hypothetical protein H0U59_10555 [Gemmatimonadaceae bacterium]|nr:hypothetical protein [Gemmatimonadaceae bacterium]